MSEQIHDINNWPDQTEMVYHMPYLEEMASKCSVIIELGCGHGNGSTRAFERGLRRAADPRLLISVDIDPARPEVRPTFEGWRKVTGDSRDAMTFVDAVSLKVADAPGVGVDLIYIDTVHEYEFLARELKLWYAFATSNTIWLFHDTFMFGQYNHMTYAIIDFCVAHPEWEYIEVTKESHGMGMMRARQ